MTAIVHPIHRLSIGGIVTFLTEYVNAGDCSIRVFQERNQNKETLYCKIQPVQPVYCMMTGIFSGSFLFSLNSTYHMF